MFLLTLSIAVTLLAWHVHHRVVGVFRLTRTPRRALALVLTLGITSAVASRLIAASAPELAQGLGTLGAAVTLSVIISSVLLWPYELLRAAWATGRWAAASVRGRSSATDDARREFLAQVTVGGAAAIATVSSTYGTLFGRHDYSLDTLPVRLEKLPRALDGFSIVQLSDVHVGLFVGERELRSGLELVRRAKPDLVVLTGDLVDHDVRYAPLLGRFARELSRFARHGVFAIPGNHDYYTGISSVLSALREAGAEVLLNRHVQIGDGGARFVLGGVDDVVAERHGGQGPSLDAAFEGAPPELARVLLSHNPTFFPHVRGQADLTLSGHTHGGQITLFINPAELVLKHGFVRGHYEHGGSQLYVNRGFGTAGPPARVGSPPEVTKLILTSSA